MDFGAGSLKLAEFEANEAGGLVLKQYAIKSLGLEGSQETKREALILKTLQKPSRPLASRPRISTSARRVSMSSKFVNCSRLIRAKSPRSSSTRRSRTSRSRSQRWFGTTKFRDDPGGELEVLLVAIKSDIVEGLFRTTAACGLSLQICDVSPPRCAIRFASITAASWKTAPCCSISGRRRAICCSSRRANFLPQHQSRANSITQDFANEAKLKFDQADKIKIDEGFVSWAGAYEEPENQHQAAISKIARQFMTRLHIQVNQTLQFYRGQQGGSAPQRLFSPVARPSCRTRRNFSRKS